MESNENITTTDIGIVSPSFNTTAANTTFQDSNNTSAILPSTSTMLSENNPSTSFIVIFCILMFIIFAITGNICIIITLLRSRHFKGVIMYYCIVNLCIVQLSESILVLTVSFSVSITGYWKYTTSFCSLNAFLVEFFSVANVVALLLLVIEKFISMQKPTMYMKWFTYPKAVLISSYVWIHSCISAVALLTSAVQIEYYNSRYFCSITHGMSRTYKITVMTVSYVLPICVIIYLYAVILRKHFKADQSDLNGSVVANQYHNQLQHQLDLCKDKHNVKNIGMILLLWCLLCGPYHLADCIYLLSSNSYTSGSNSIETLLSVMKLSYPAVVPICITVLWVDVRRQMKQVLLCRVNDIATVQLRQQEGILQQENVLPLEFNTSSGNNTSKNDVNLGTAYQVPVLFATSNGLQLTVVRNKKDSDIASTGKRISSGIRISDGTVFPNFGVVNFTVDELENYSIDVSEDDETLNTSWRSQVETQQPVVTRTDVRIEQSLPVEPVVPQSKPVT
ncbi:alpha-1B adrenergic receptor-like [Anneissia japonica]|uniref:alpha-1B adrenergic receptor-like n=1 Tax=Anneissia japonica TaxID=1529436 RepID=UPI0014258BF2|nr:alpha-1B adrenergic receptor-like [Anneissia japonica]